MPELPDVTVYIEHLERLVVGAELERVRLASPFVVRTAVPPIRAAEGRRIDGASRLGKRIVLTLAPHAEHPRHHLVVHLMIAGRFRWKDEDAKGPAPIPGKLGLAAFDVKGRGTLLLTEASTQKRASIHLVDDAGLTALDPGGVEIADLDHAGFAALLRQENHTLKRTLTDPRVFSGIGNAYSDEILHAAKLSPIKQTQKLTDEEIRRLEASTRSVLATWTERLRERAGAFPEKVTAFQPDMAVHGKFGKPCPVCGTPVQRIRYAANESNYCPTCQTEGKLLADRSLSRLMKGDWPKTLEELEAKKRDQGAPKPAPARARAQEAEPAAKPPPKPKVKAAPKRRPS